MAVDLIVVSTEWCGPCKNMERAGVYAAVESAGFPVIKIDADKDPITANKYGANAVPTLVIRKDGQAVGKLIGARTAESLIAEMQRFE